MGLNTWTPSVRNMHEWMSRRFSDFAQTDASAISDETLPRDMQPLRPYRSERSGMVMLVCAYENEADEQQAFNAIASCLPAERRPPLGRAAWTLLPPDTESDVIKSRGYMAAQWEA